MESEYIIRNMTQEEVENIAVEWAANEGWNPGLHDALSFYAADPNGFFVGMLNDEPISCISAVAYDNTFGFIGFYMVKPAYRGKGYGLKLWDKAMAYLNTQNIGLDGVIEQQDNYKKSGFTLAYSNIRYEGLATHTDKQFADILPISKVSFADITKYDAKHFPVPRAQFLEAWLRQEDSLPLVAVDNNTIKGYGMIRKCRVGYKIGPLFANNQNVAKQLYLSLSNFAEPGASVFLDVPDINFAAIEFAESYGMKKVFGTARMYTKSTPNIEIKNIFGVTSFELG